MALQDQGIKNDLSWLAVPVVFLLLYAAAVLFRPPLPIDETRYLSVAWEMWLRGDWFAPLTVNFEPYHHKPPLLFWSINTAWSVFGVSRWAATIPVALAAMLATLLSGKIAARLLPELGSRAVVVMLGTFGFLVYATVILFDLTLTVFVLGALLCLLAYAESRRARYMLFMGILLGLGVLTKGPVAYLYVIFPVLLAPYWMAPMTNRKGWYLGSLAALLISLPLVLAWLIPVLGASSKEFGYWLLWEQTAGRVTGNFASSHARPAYFYILLMPIMLLPWALFPKFWKGFAVLKRSAAERQGIRFLIAWVLPTFLAFSLISGKQPHYMVPLLPGIAILIAFALRQIPARRLQVATALMLLGFISVHVALPATVRERFDLLPIAESIAAHPERPYAFAGGHYRGEFGFLARLRRPLDTPSVEELDVWFSEHPDGYAIIRYRNPEDVGAYEALVTRPYRGKRIGLFTTRNQQSPAMRGFAKGITTNDQSSSSSGGTNFSVSAALCFTSFMR